MHRVAFLKSPRFLTGTYSVLLALLCAPSLALAAPMELPRPLSPTPPPSKSVQLDAFQPAGTPPDADDTDSVPHEELIFSTRNPMPLISATLGLWSGNFGDAESATSLFGGITRTSYKLEDQAWEYGLQLLQTGYLGIDGGKKFILSPYKWNEPFVKFGIGSLWKSNEGLSTFTNIYRYQMRFEAGFEDLMQLKRRWRTTACFAWGLNGAAFAISTGFSF